MQQLPAHAESALRKAVTLEPLLERGWYYLALALQQLERDEEAMAALRKSLDVTPSFHRPYKTLVELLLSAGQRDEARRYLLRGMKNIEEPAFLESVRLE
jgi:Flp pilus assembly protein TadD